MPWRPHAVQSIRRAELLHAAPEMSALHIARVEETETDGILRWRYTQLLAAGYATRTALELATHSEVDLHRATELRSRGCPDDLAIRILL
jgi:hypothetical protein